MRGWQREQLVFGAGAFAKPGISLEQEYLNMLLLMRLDSGNFTPDQVEWVAQPARGLGADADADAAAGREGAVSSSISTGSQGLRRRDQPRRRRARDVSSTPRRFTRASSSGCAGCPRQDERKAEPPATCPPREQRLLLMRLAALFGPDAIAHAPRASRAISRRATCASSSGLHALTRAVAEIDRLPEPARTPGVVSELRRGHADRQSRHQSRIGRAAHPRHPLEDGRSQRQRLPAGGARPRRRRRSWASSSRSRMATTGCSASCGACSASRSTR